MAFRTSWGNVNEDFPCSPATDTRNLYEHAPHAPADHPLQELLFIRHGETEWNSRKVIQGFKDIPLSPAGIEQTLAIAGRLAGSRIDAIYTSPLRRAAISPSGSGSPNCRQVYAWYLP